MIVSSIDPGPFVSHVVEFDGKRVTQTVEVENDAVMRDAQDGRPPCHDNEFGFIEDFVPYGSPVSADSIRTIKLIGVCQWFGVTAISRKDVKLHLCGTLQKIGDKQIRESLIERFGPGEKAAKGSKKQPGPLYGVAGHYWAALAVAVVAWDRLADAEETMERATDG